MIVSLPPSQPPQLMVVIDTEEEFDWSQPLTREATDVTALREIGRAQDIFDRFGIVPVYAVDYPVASQADQAPDLTAAIADARALVGAHLNSWVTPPFEEELSEHFSFQGNLPKALEREKLIRLKAGIEERFGVTPVMHKAGRYGVGANTME
ncbi:MAG: WalW protein, partial [Alphaproteobacteria bacterium]|nr:WalW protein [Alphaproteobacteria bacterium]